MTNILTLLLALVWPLGQLLELPPPFPGTHLYALDILALLFSLHLLLSARSRQQVFKDQLFKPLLIFSTIATLSLALNASNLSPSQLVISLAYLARWTIYASFYFFFKIYPLKNIRLILFPLVVFTILGAAQYFFLPDTRFLQAFGFDDHYYRLIGTFLDPNFTGLILAITTLISFSFLVGKKKLFSLIPLTALALTFSRSSYLAFLAGLIYLSIKKKNFLPLAATIALLGLGILLAPKPSGEGVNLLRTYSISSRLSNTTNALKDFVDKPILGYGFNTLNNPQSSLYPNRASRGLSNSFVFVLLTTGLVGFVSYLYLLTSSFHTSKHLVVKASFVTLFTHSLFNHSLFYIWILSLFWVLVALPKEKS